MGYNLIYNKVIQDKSNYNRSNLKELISILDEYTKVVYIYSLEEEEINYPKKMEILFI